MSNKLVRAAIESRLAAWAAARSPALAVAWENVPYTPGSSSYLRAFLLPAATTGIDLAGAGLTYRGVYQVNIVSQINTGPGFAEGVVIELAALFPLNILLPVTGLTLQVLGPVTAAQGAQDSTNFVMPVSFQYRADVI